MKTALKTALKYSLATIGVSALIVGGVFAFVGPERKESANDAKRTLFNRYRMTEEFRGALLSELETLELGLKQGLITKEQFEEKTDYLYTDEYVEKTIVEGDVIEYQNKLAEIIKQSEAGEKMGIGGILISGAGIGALAGAVYVSTKEEEKE